MNLDLRPSSFLTLSLLVTPPPGTLCCYATFCRMTRYGPAKDAVCNAMGLKEEDVHNITGGTAQALFGSWVDDA